MIDLCRTMRFCLDDAPPPRGAGAAKAGPGANTWSAWPAMRGLGRFYQMRVRCRGEVDPLTGYFINIKELDRAFHQAVLPYLQSLLVHARTAGGIPLGEVLRRALAAFREALGPVVEQVDLDLTPFYRLEIRSRDMEQVTLRQQFEFSAGHRLHVPSLSDEENRRLFGKCNHPSGHGHNYRIEVAVRGPIGPEGQVLRVEDLDALVDRAVIQKVDHRNLNVDVPEFGRLNPSVENIARVVYGWLAGEIGRLGVELHEVSVWETPKTVCTYRGE